MTVLTVVMALVIGIAVGWRLKGSPRVESWVSENAVCRIRPIKPGLYEIDVWFEGRHRGEVAAGDMGVASERAKQMVRSMGGTAP